MFQRLHQNPHHKLCARGLFGGHGVPKNCTRTPYPGRLVFSLLRRWGGVPKVGVVFQRVVPESSMERCSKSSGGVPKSCLRIPTARRDCVPKSCPRIPSLYTTMGNYQISILLLKSSNTLQHDNRTEARKLEKVTNKTVYCELRNLLFPIYVFFNQYYSISGREISK